MPQPKAPDPHSTAQAQLGYSTQAAQKTQQMNQYDQTTPFGSLKYVQSGTNPDGTPKFTVDQSFNPQVQSTIDALMGKAQTAANTDLSGDAITGRQMDLYSKYMDPIFSMQKGGLEAELRNKGITPGSKQYDTQMNLQSRNTNDALTKFLLDSRGTALNEATTEGMFPFQQMGAAVSSMSPQYAQTPQVSVQTPNYEASVANKANMDSSRYNSMMSGLFSIPTAALGGWGRSGFKF